MELSQSLSELAGEAYGWFEHKTRNNGEGFVTLKDGRDEWVNDLVYAAHGDFGPDDYRYNAIQNALRHIADNDTDEDSASDFADSEVDVYTAERFAWLASNLQRAGYVDEAREDLGPTGSVVDDIGRGQYLELQEVYSSVVGSLEARLEELESEENA